MGLKPTAEDIANAMDKTVDDVIDFELCILFCGINPGLYTAAVGHHFAHPANRFWSTLYKAGLTDRLLSPYEEDDLLKRKIGITNLISRASLKATDLQETEYKRGRAELEKKVLKYKPKNLVFLGMEAYRKAYGIKNIFVGKQEGVLIGATQIWVLPNTSGLNASYKPRDFVAVFAKMKDKINCL